MTKTMKAKIKEYIKELFEEEEKEKAKKTEEEKIMVEYSSEDKNPQPTTKGPYMVLYVEPTPSPFRKNTVGWMGSYSKLYQSNHVTCIEQTGNLEKIEADSKFTVLLKDLKKPPKRETMRKFIDAYTLNEGQIEERLKKPAPKKDSKKKNSKKSSKKKAKGKKK